MPVLQIATIVAARVMKEDKDYGSIAVGKVADLAIVDGHPTERLCLGAGLSLSRRQFCRAAGRSHRKLRPCGVTVSRYAGVHYYYRYARAPGVHNIGPRDSTAKTQFRVDALYQ